jgi:hypothetical protein
MTAGGPEDRGRCSAAGMDGLLVKPLRQADLAGLLREFTGAALPPPPPPAAAPLDTGRLSEFVGGDEGLLRSLAGLFLLEAPELLSAVREASAAATPPALARAAHKLRGEVSAFGSPGSPRRRDASRPPATPATQAGGRRRGAGRPRKRTRPPHVRAAGPGVSPLLSSPSDHRSRAAARRAGIRKAPETPPPGSPAALHSRPVLIQHPVSPSRRGAAPRRAAPRRPRRGGAVGTDRMHLGRTGST